MKKLIQFCTLLSLTFIFAAVSANAQSGYGSEVEIPFNFNIGDRSYNAGHYIVKVSKLESGTASLAIQDTKTDEIQHVMMSANGDAAGTEFKLVFATVGDQRFLSKVQMTDKTYSIVRSKTERDARRGAETGTAAGGLF